MFRKKLPTAGHTNRGIPPAPPGLEPPSRVNHSRRGARGGTRTVARGPRSLRDPALEPLVPSLHQEGLAPLLGRRLLEACCTTPCLKHVRGESPRHPPGSSPPAGSTTQGVVREGGLEPPRFIQPRGPKPRASTNSATLADLRPRPFSMERGHGLMSDLLSF